MTSHRVSILTESEITIGFRLNYLANFFVGPVYKKVAELSGLARSDFVVIFCLKHLGMLTAQDVCEVTGRPKNSISQAVTKLVAQNLIEKRTDAADARRAPLLLTARGKALYTELIPLFQQREAEMLGALSDRERLQFERLLGKLVLRNDEWAKSN